MSQQDSIFQERPSSFVTQMQNRSIGQLPTHILPHSQLPRAIDVPGGTPFPTQDLHMSHHSTGPYFGCASISGYDFPKLGGQHPFMLPECNAPSEKQEILFGTATLDLDGFSIPFLAQSGSCGLTSDASPGTSPLPTSPSSSLQVAHKQSRLPTSTVGRKAPRKSTVVPNWPIKSSNEVIKGKNRSIAPCLTKQASIPNTARSSSCPNKDTSKNSSSRLMMKSVSAKPRPIGSKKAVASKQDHQTIAFSTPQSRRVPLSEGDKTSTPGSATEVRDEQENRSPCSPITTRGHSRATKQHLRPQPRYKYDVPPELECVKRALGQDDWTEYLVLVEKHALKEVTEQTYNSMSRRMYYVINATLRKKIETMVIERMIGPVVGHRDRFEEETIDKDDSSEDFRTMLSVKREESVSTMSTPSTTSQSE